MSRKLGVTMVIERDGEGYFAFCPELDVASQGGTIDEARANLAEAIELFIEAADLTEIERRVENDPAFLERVRTARESLSGRGVRIEDVAR